MAASLLTKTVSRLINIASIEDGVVVDFSLNPTLCYEVYGSDISMKSEDEQIEYLTAVEKFLNRISEGITLSFQVVHDTNSMQEINLSAYEADTVPGEKIRRYIHQDGLLHLRDTFTRKFQVFCFVSYDNAFKSDPVYFLPFVFDSVTKKNNSEVFEKSVDLLKAFMANDANILSSFGIKFRQLNTPEIFKLCYEYLNPNRKHTVQNPGLIEAIPDLEDQEFYAENSHLKNITIREQLALSPIDNQSEKIEMDGAYLSSVNLDYLPSIADESATSSVLALAPHSYISTVSISCPSQEKELSKLNRKQKLLRATSGIVSQYTGVESETKDKYEALSSVDEISETVNDLSKLEQKLFKIRQACVLSDRNSKALDAATEWTISKWSNVHNAIAIKDNYCHLKNVLSVLPGQYFFNHRVHAILTKPATFFLPFVTSWKGCNDRASFLLKTKTAELLPLNFENNGLPASHSIVMAPTGSGKSFTMNYLLLKLLSSPGGEKWRVTIIDKGGSYPKLCALFGGDYIKIELHEKYAVNPFPKKEDILQDGEIDRDQLSFLRKLMVLIISDNNISDITASQEHILESAISILYKEFEGDGAPLLEDFQEQLAKTEPRDTEDAQFLVKAIKNLDLYTADESSYSVLLNRPTSISFTNPFLVFDRTALAEHPRLQAIYFFILNNLINLRMKNGLVENIRQFVVFEEVADLLIDKASAELISEKYRTARKYGTVMCCVTQMVGDFVKNPLVSAITGNSMIKFILKLRSSEERALLKEMDFNESEISHVKNLEIVTGKYSDLFIKFGQDSVVARIEPSKLEYEICSTDKDSFQRYKDVLNSGCQQQVFEEVKKHAKA